MCVTLVVSTDGESCVRPISTNPGSMEAREYGLTRGTIFVASRLEVVAVTEMLWLSWLILGAAGFRVFNDFAFSNSCARPLAARDPEQSASTRSRGYDSQPICPPRTRGRRSPPSVPFIVLPP